MKAENFMSIQNAFLWQQVSDAIIATDENLVITAWNQAAEKIYGWTEAEAKGQQINELLKTEWVSDEQARGKATLVTSGTWRGEIRQQTKTGGWRYISASVNWLKNEQGEVTGGVTVNRDITERQQIQEALDAERQLFVGGPTVIFKWGGGPGWMVEYVSPNVFEQFGYTPQALTSGSISYASIIHPADLGRIVQEVNAHKAARHTQFEQEYRIRCADGRYRWLFDFTVANYDATGMVTCYHGYVQDITARKQAEEALRASEERHRLIVETAQEGIWLLDETFQTTFVNQRMAHMLGYTREELQNRSVFEFVTGEGRAELHACLLQQPPEAKQPDILFMHKNGHGIWTIVSANPLPNAEGRFIGTLMMLVEITERKQAEHLRREQERLKASLQKEQELNALVQKTITALSHDLRAPLTIIWYAKDMLDRYYNRIDEQKRREKLQLIDKQLRYILELLDDMTLVVKGSYSHSIFKPAPVNLPALCQLCVNEIQETTGSDHELLFVTDGLIQTVPVDEVLVSRILLNLLSNAVKFSPRESEIRLELARHEESIVLHVVDNGIGIAETDLPYIFDTFYRADAARTVEGFGLGLNIVKECVERHHGQVGVASVLGKGTTFTVRLPLTEANGAAQEKSGFSPPPEMARPESSSDPGMDRGNHG